MVIDYFSGYNRGMENLSKSFVNARTQDRLDLEEARRQADEERRNLLTGQQIRLGDIRLREAARTEANRKQLADLFKANKVEESTVPPTSEEGGASYPGQAFSPAVPYTPQEQTQRVSQTLMAQGDVAGGMKVAQEAQTMNQQQAMALDHVLGVGEKVIKMGGDFNTAKQMMMGAAQQWGVDPSKFNSITDIGAGNIKGTLDDGRKYEIIRVPGGQPHVVVEPKPELTTLQGKEGPVIGPKVSGAKPYEKPEAPTELKLIRDSQEKDPITGKPTPKAVAAQQDLDAELKRKLEIAKASTQAKTEGIDVNALAEAVAEGQKASSEIKNAFGVAVSAQVDTKVLQKYPNYSFTKAEANKRGIENMAFVRARENVNSIVQSAEMVKKYALALDNGNIQLANRIANEWAAQTGNPAPTNWRVAAVAMSQEFNRAYSDSVVNPEGRFNKELKNLAEVGSPKQLIGALDTNLELTKIRGTAIQNMIQPYSWDEVKGIKKTPASERTKVEPRKPGESVADYLKRTSGK